MFVIASLLLIIPGFITDIIALLIFIPAVRDLAWNTQPPLRGRWPSIAAKGASRLEASRISAMRNRTPVVDLDEEDYQRDLDRKSPWSGKHLGKCASKRPRTHGWLRVVTTSAK
jgi:UPF0716 protein FxsA